MIALITRDYSLILAAFRARLEFSQGFCRLLPVFRTLVDRGTVEGGRRQLESNQDSVIVPWYRLSVLVQAQDEPRDPGMVLALLRLGPFGPQVPLGYFVPSFPKPHGLQNGRLLPTPA